MKATVGTFNLNNLFSRYNFKGEIQAIRSNDTEVDSGIEYTFGPDDVYRIRRYRGKLVKGKKPAETRKIADRILAMNVDLLAVQEVEDIDTLREFNRTHLNGLYDHLVLVEGNDPRLIDVGLMSKLPLGAISSWQAAVHPDKPDERVFGRDLLGVEVLNPARTRTLFTIFNNHLKSQFVDPRDDPDEGKQKNDARRKRQAEMIHQIVTARTRPGSRFLIVGDMNDPPDSAPLAPLTDAADLPLTDALANPTETRPPKSDDPMPASPAWTHRLKPPRRPAHYELFDQIWLSRSLASKQTGAWIDRRTKHSGDGSDHDPAWIELNL